MQTLSQWQQDTDLAGIRDQAALPKLPSEEQNAFTQFWVDAAQLLDEGGDRLSCLAGRDSRLRRCERS